MIYFKLLVCIHDRANADVTHSNRHSLTAVIESERCWIDLNLIRSTCSDLHLDMHLLLFGREWPSQLKLIEVWEVAMNKDEMPLREHKSRLV